MYDHVVLARLNPPRGSKDDKDVERTHPSHRAGFGLAMKEAGARADDIQRLQSVGVEVYPTLGSFINQAVNVDYVDYVD